MLLEMKWCRGCCDGGGCDVEVSGDDGWRSSLRFRASYHVCQAWPVRCASELILFATTNSTFFPPPHILGEQKQ
jgi:hypothetical protein